MSTTHVNEHNFDAEVLHADKMVLIDFYADWCGPCKKMAPLLEDFSNEHADVKVVKINIEESRELAAAFGVQSIPTFVTMQDGEAVFGAVGAMPKSSLETLLSESQKKVANSNTPPKPGRPQDPSL